MENYLQIQVDKSLKRRVKMKCAYAGVTVRTVITKLLEGWVDGEIVLDPIEEEEEEEE